MANIKIDVTYYLYEVSTPDLIDELLGRDIDEISEKLIEWTELRQYPTKALVDEIVYREDSEDFKDELRESCGIEEESDEINLDELDHSLFYMSQDDFSKLLKIVEYHKEHRNG